jgi:hypothetical protein
MQYPLLCALVVFAFGTTNTSIADTVKHDIVYTCTNADGSKSFSGLPCGPNAKRSEYKVATPPKPAAVETPPPRSGEIINETGQQQASAMNKGTKLNPQPPTARKKPNDDPSKKP